MDIDEAGRHHALRVHTRGEDKGRTNLVAKVVRTLRDGFPSGSCVALACVLEWGITQLKESARAQTIQRALEQSGPILNVTQKLATAYEIKRRRCSSPIRVDVIEYEAAVRLGRMLDGRNI